MKQTIEIEVPDGKVAVWENGQVFFKDAKPLPKTWDEYYKFYIADEPSYLRVACITDVPNYIAQQHMALIQLHRLRDCYRQGWVPDWTDCEEKWVIYKVSGKLNVNFAVDFDRFLSFPTEKLANEFLNNFRDLIEQAGDLI